MAEDSKLQAAANKPELIHYVNAKNAKIVSLIILLGFLLYHGILHLAYGIDSCKWLLSDGRFQGHHVWQPYGCMLHTYSEIDTVRCMKYTAYWGDDNHILFVGDSRIRVLYEAFVQQINSSYYLKDFAGKHNDFQYVDKKLKLDVRFMWRPFVDTSMYQVYESWLRQPPDKYPSVVVSGSGAWTIKAMNDSEQALLFYTQNLTRLVPILHKLADTSKVLWMLQDPVVHEKLSDDRKVITNEQIDLYNKAAMDVLRHSSVRIWSSSRLVAQGYNDDWDDGMHAGKVALNYYVQMLLNMYCNDKMNHQDGTCCSSAEPVTTLQILTFSMFTVCAVTALIVIIHQKRILLKPYRWLQTFPVHQTNENTFSELVINLAKLGFIMGYFFLCDRTNFFMKGNKYYSHLNFFLPISYLFVLGLFFTEESKYTQVLHRDQTDEWMGWMQLVILVYHMTHASQNLPIYAHLRVIVGTFLFMTGFKHFTYFFKKGDFGLIRLFQSRFRHFPNYWSNSNNGLRRLLEILFRLNLLAVMLCLCMNRPYQSYYFVPLVSFWFLVVWITMSVIPQITNASCEANYLHYLYMIIKFLIAFGVITTFYMSEVFFERLFVTRPWKALFVTADDSIKEWWFRWKLDRYAILSGMVFAFILHILQRNRIIEDHNHNNLFTRSLGWLIALFGFIALVCFTSSTFFCKSKAECNEVHSYVFWIPILGYIILRNVSGLIRSRYSAFFAWFGKISLELFVGQYHIWLAADTNGILVLVPSYPVLNIVITSFIFVCISHEINNITGKLVKYAIPNDWKLLVRNIFIFFLILVPIGIYDGMF